jgi:hypothetical protein
MRMQPTQGVPVGIAGRSMPDVRGDAGTHGADAPSLRLLRFVTAGGVAAPLLLLGTYRDAELGADHPLKRLGEPKVATLDRRDSVVVPRLIRWLLEPQEVVRPVYTPETSADEARVERLSLRAGPARRGSSVLSGRSANVLSVPSNAITAGQRQVFGAVAQLEERFPCKHMAGCAVRLGETPGEHRA